MEGQAVSDALAVLACAAGWLLWSVLIGWLVFGEALTVTTLAGTALIVVGCLVATRRKPGPVEHTETTAL